MTKSDLRQEEEDQRNLCREEEEGVQLLRRGALAKERQSPLWSAGKMALLPELPPGYSHARQKGPKRQVQTLLQAVGL
jgi:hypothetical protein